MTQRLGPAFLLPFLAVLVGVVAFLLLQDSSFVAAGGGLEYPLDDPYIHLAVAEQLRAGGYGVNAGEYAAASSSPLFPVLLMPFAGTDFHSWMPFIWNVVGLVLAAALWGRILWQAGYGASALGMVLAAIGPLLLNFVGVAYTGMEHALHVAASLAIVLGLLRFVDDGVIGGALIAGVLLAPLLRFEGLALALMAAAVVLSQRRLLRGLGLLVLASVPVAAYSYWLTVLGLDPLPGSATVRLDLPQGAGLVDVVMAKLAVNLPKTSTQALLGYLAVAAVLLFTPPVRASGRWLLVVAVASAGLAHLLLGDFGGMDRYEIYILASLAAGLLAASAAPFARRLPMLPILPMVLAATVYLPGLVSIYPAAGNAVHLQQAQMGRFAKDFLKEPVAVNEIGHVAWQNPNYVLDLSGAANPMARAQRLRAPHPEWADDLTAVRQVHFAMIYEDGLPQATAPGWARLGQLNMDAKADTLGRTVVSFFLTGPWDRAPYVAKLQAWQLGLPKGASFEFAEGIAP